MKKQTFNRGVHPDGNKALTSDKPIETMPLCSDYYVALSQHIGAPARAVVSAGDEVAQGQLLAEAGGYVSAKIFSPVSGVIEGIVKKNNLQGVASDYIHVRKEGDRKVTLPRLDEPTAEVIKKRISDAGIVGLGGAGFPAAVKINPSKPVDVLLINAAECEPYLNCDNRLLLEQTAGVIEGIRLLARALNVNNVIIGIEDNKQDAYAQLTSSGYEIIKLQTRYPQGAEKVLIYACTGRKVPTGGLPADVGVVVHNVATAFAVYQACALGEPLYKRVLTVSGRGITNPKNVLVLNGTPHKEIFEFCGGLTDNAVKLISGGPMMGLPMQDDGGFTTKAESGLLALTKAEISLAEPTPCINCARCASVCPMHLMPMYIDFYTLVGDTQSAVRYGALDCIECGCCSYVCPAKRWLVQSVRLTKKRVREAKK